MTEELTSRQGLIYSGIVFSAGMPKLFVAKDRHRTLCNISRTNLDRNARTIFIAWLTNEKNMYLKLPFILNAEKIIT